MTVTESRDHDTRTTLSQRIAESGGHQVRRPHQLEGFDRPSIDELAEWQRQYQHRELDPIPTPRRWLVAVGLLLALLTIGLLLVSVAGLLVYTHLLTGA